MKRRKKVKSFWELTVDQITVEDLGEIALADYGQTVEQHFRALADIHQSGIIPLDLEWCPLEVLSLTRWTEYRKYPQRPEYENQVLFCALVLVLACCQGDGCVDGLSNNMAIICEIVSRRERHWQEALKHLLEDLFVKTDRKHLDDDMLYIPFSLWVVSNLLEDQKGEIQKWKIATLNEALIMLKSGYYELQKSVLHYTYFDMRHHLWNTFCHRFGWNGEGIVWDGVFKIQL